ncbi:GNAT family N-acetyltransferase [Metabacillus sp. HB246100]
MIEIRLSQAKDFAQLLHLDHKVWNEVTTPSVINWESIEQFSSKNPEGSQLVALDDGMVVGYLGYHYPTPLETNKHVYEMDIAVNPDHQGKGVGSMLLHTFIEMAQKHSIHKLSLRVLESNQKAIHFYRKNGFKEQGRLVKEFYVNGNYVDDILMYKLINT